MIDMVIAYALLASGNVANKLLLKSISPELLVGIRMSVSGLLILLWSVRKSPRLRWSYIRNDIRILAVISIITTLLPALLKAFALTYMAPSKQMLLGSIDPFITAGYAYLLWREPLSWRKALGITVGCIGIGISAISSSPSEQLWGEWWIFSLPEVAVVLAVALGRYGWMVVQTMLRNGRYLPHELTALSMMASGMLSLAISLARGKTFLFSGATPNNFISIVLYTTFIGNIAGYTAYSYCLHRHNATVVALTGLLMPLFVAFMSWGIGLESLSWNFFIAMSFVTGGMTIFYSKPRIIDNNKPGLLQSE
jgi:drug/metabolite transporter (DMT)-like permease